MQLDANDMNKPFLVMQVYTYDMNWHWDSYSHEQALSKHVALPLYKWNNKHPIQ